MDKLKTTGLGGFPFILDDIRWFLGRTINGNQGIYVAFNHILRGYGDNFIVQGCVASGASPNVAITEGWIMLGGELIKVNAQTGINTTTDNKFVKAITFDPAGDKVFQNGNNADTYEINRASVTGTTGNLRFDGFSFSDLRSVADTDAGSRPIKKKIIDIGGWNMDSDQTKSVAHGLSSDDFENIRSVDVIIVNDSDSLRHPLTAFANQVSQGGVTQVTTSNVLLERLDTPGIFDAATYSSLAIATRGWINIEFELKKT